MSETLSETPMVSLKPLREPAKESDTGTAYLVLLQHALRTA